jgi:hypothetical protein
MASGKKNNRNEFFETIVPGPTIYKDRKTLTIYQFVITL